MTRLPALALLVACGLAPAAGACRAEMPPQAYEAMRQKAALVLLLEIQAVQRSAARTEGALQTTDILARARVLSVIRGTGPKMGDIVTIRYAHRRPRQPGWAGPAPIPLLKQGSRVLAWLDRAEGFLAPAARGRSFEALR